LVEGFGEAFGGFDVDFLDDGEEFGLGVDEVVVLAAEEVVAFFEFVEFGDGVEVDGADGVELALEVGEGFLDVVPVGFGLVGGEFGDVLLCAF